jgi:hypothetical protein
MGYHGTPKRPRILPNILLAEDSCRRQIAVEGILALRLASSVRGIYRTAGGAIALHIVGSHASPRWQAAVLFLPRKMRV